MEQTKLIAAATQILTAHLRSSPIEGSSSTLRHIGLENEYVMVTLDGSIMKPMVLQFLWEELIDQGWEPAIDLSTGKIISVTRPRAIPTTAGTHDFDIITTDFGYATLEIDLAPAQSIHEAQSCLLPLLDTITTILNKHDTRLLGYGVQPVARPQHEYLGPKSRYELLYTTRLDERSYNPKAYLNDLHCINAACQTQVEVTKEEALPILNALNATAGLRIALLANSSIWQNEVSDYKAMRELFWDWGWPNRRLQMGIPPRFYTFEHYVDYLFDFRAIMVKRADVFYRIDNHRSFRQCMLAEEGILGRAEGSRTLMIAGSPEDIKTQYSFGWFNTRLHPSHGTIEDRVSCQQPPQEHFCASALTLGLTENNQQLISLSSELSLDQWRELRLLACTYGLAFEYYGVDVHALIQRLLNIAHDGLRARGLGEESYLAPLFTRLTERNTPADAAIACFNEGGIPALVNSVDMRNLL